MTAYLMLEDGCVFKGEPRGKFKETVCEVVFNTAMTGYVETLTDPSYAGQGIVMSYPIIGNYGVNEEDFESEKLQSSAFLVHELCNTPSNFRCEMTIEELLIKYNIPCVSGLDTRSIVKHIRENGTMRGIITTDISDTDALLAKIKAYNPENLINEVTSDKPAVIDGEGARIAVMNFGVKKSFIDSLTKHGCRVTIYPAFTKAEEILKDAPDGILLSNGPDNPAKYAGIIAEVKKLFDSNTPIFGIALGHQLATLANGGKTEKMVYGNRGANQPVKFLDDDSTYLTSQNHGYAVTEAPANSEVSAVNVNDKSIEAIKYSDKPAFTVQFHPDSNEGPRGTAFLFDKFLEMIKEGNAR